MVQCKNSKLESLGKLLRPEVAETKDEQEQMFGGERGEIISRYRIPSQNNDLDHKLQLPDDSDSSQLSSENELPKKKPPVEPKLAPVIEVDDQDENMAQID